MRSHERPFPLGTFQLFSPRSSAPPVPQPSRSAPSRAQEPTRTIPSHGAVLTGAGAAGGVVEGQRRRVQFFFFTTKDFGTSFPVGRFITSDYANTVTRAAAVGTERPSRPVSSAIQRASARTCVGACAGISRGRLPARLLDTSPGATAWLGCECS